MTGPGSGTIYYREDLELVGRVIAEKLRLKRIPLDARDAVRVEPKRRAA